MDKSRRVFSPGDYVSVATGEIGVIINREMYEKIKNVLREGPRPGHYFAPGCCPNPDYLVQAPVLFEDGTYDVMRTLHIKKKEDTPPDKRESLRRALENAASM